MIRIEYLSEFVTLAETLNFSRTADMHYISQPSLTRHISELENDFGCKLFSRTTRVVTLTEAGESAYHSCHDFLQQYELFNKQIADLSNNQKQ